MYVCVHVQSEDDVPESVFALITPTLENEHELSSLEVSGFKTSHLVTCCIIVLNSFLTDMTQRQLKGERVYSDTLLERLSSS